jgi:hypothetical protein
LLLLSVFLLFRLAARLPEAQVSEAIKTEALVGGDVAGELQR